jgi:hypothetical protein
VADAATGPKNHATQGKEDKKEVLMCSESYFVANYKIVIVSTVVTFV